MDQIGLSPMVIKQSTHLKNPNRTDKGFLDVRMVIFKIKGIKMYGKNIILTLSTVACMGLMTACGGGGSGSGGSGGHASGAIAQKEFISITQNDSRETCEVIKLIADTAFIDPIVSIEVKTIDCGDYGRSDIKCHVATYDEDVGNIACVIGHDGLI